MMIALTDKNIIIGGKNNHHANNEVYRDLFIEKNNTNKNT